MFSLQSFIYYVYYCPEFPLYEATDMTAKAQFQNSAATESAQPQTRTDGTVEWRLAGVLHRKDGPAIESANGEKEWFWHGQPLSEEDFWRTAIEDGALSAERATMLKNDISVPQIKIKPRRIK